MYKKYERGKSAYTLNMEVRVGDTKLLKAFGKQRITVNKVCGTISGTASNPAETFDCQPTRRGRYISLQTTHTRNIFIGEINVFTRGAHYHGIKKTLVLIQQDWYDITGKISWCCHRSVINKQVMARQLELEDKGSLPEKKTDYDFKAPSDWFSDVGSFWDLSNSAGCDDSATKIFGLA